MPSGLANFISIVFHPLLMPTYTFLLILLINPYLSSALPAPFRYYALAIIFTTTFLLPLLSALVIKKIGLIKSLLMERKEERILPFVLTTFYYCIGFLILNKLSLPYVITALMFGATLVVFYTAFITIFWKISIHLVGIGGLTGGLFILFHFYIYDVFTPLIVVTILAGLIGYARLSVSTHNAPQVYVGFLIGVLGEITVLWI